MLASDPWLMYRPGTAVAYLKILVGGSAPPSQRHNRGRMQTRLAQQFRVLFVFGATHRLFQYLCHLSIPTPCLRRYANCSQRVSNYVKE
jgi:hypothetical protein